MIYRPRLTGNLSPFPHNAVRIPCYCRIGADLLIYMLQDSDNLELIGELGGRPPHEGICESSATTVVCRLHG